MRPPVLPSGNKALGYSTLGSAARFNEAAGFTQRKHHRAVPARHQGCHRFNEAAGFTQRKRGGSMSEDRQDSMLQ